MNDLERKVTDLLDRRAQEASVSPDAWERIQERLQPSRSQSRGRLLLGGAVAAGLIVALGGLGSTVVPDRSPVEIVPAQQPSPVEPSSTTVDAQPQAPVYHWEAIAGSSDARASDAYLWVNDAAARGDIVVVVADGAVWRSPDRGRTWEQVADSVFDSPGRADYDVRAVTATDDGFVAAGGLPNVGMVWRSSDGRSWDRIEIDGAGVLYDAVVGDGLVVVSGRSPDGAAVFFSSDAGQSWERAQIGSADGGGENGMFVLAYGPAGWVASGYGGGASSLATTWTSPDGREWELVADPGFSDVGVVDAIASNASGYLALQAGGAVYRSTDGHDWKQIGTIGSGQVASSDGDSTVRFSGLQAVDGGWMAIGSTAGQERAPYAYTSIDGSVWQTTKLAAHGRSTAFAVTADGTAITAAAGDRCGGEQDTCDDILHVWIGTPPTTRSDD